MRLFVIIGLLYEKKNHKTDIKGKGKRYPLPTHTHTHRQTPKVPASLTRLGGHSTKRQAVRLSIPSAATNLRWNESHFRGQKLVIFATLFFFLLVLLRLLQEIDVTTSTKIEWKSS